MSDDYAVGNDSIGRADTDLALEAAGLGVWTYDNRTGMVSLDSRCCQLLGIQAVDRLAYADVLRLLVPADAEQAGDWIQQAVRAGVGNRVQRRIRVVGQDGQWRAIQLTGRGYSDESGRLVRYAGVAIDVISEQHHQIETTHALFRPIIEQAPVAMGLLVGREQRIEAANEAMIAIWGKGAGVVGKPVADALPALADPHFLARLDTLFTTGEPFWVSGGQVDVVMAGRPKKMQVDFVAAPFREEDGRVAGVIMAAIDTTEQITARQQLDESEKRFQAMAEESGILIALSDESSHATYFSRAWIELTGRPMKALLNVGWTDLIHPDDRERFVKAYLSAFAAREPFADEFRLVSHTGSEHWLMAEGRPRFGADGTFLGCISSAVDITSARQVQEALRVSEAKQRSIVANAPAGIGLFVGRELIIESPNQTFIDIVGKGWDIVGKPLREVMPELISENQPFLAILDDVYTSGRMFQSYGSLVQIVQDGVMTSNYYNITYTPLFDDKGEVYAILDIAVDVTGQILAQQRAEASETRYRDLAQQLDEQVNLRTQELGATNEELIATNEELIAANEDMLISNQALETANYDLLRSNENLEQFAYVASHDLQEPLRKIQQFGDLLKNRYADTTGEERFYLDRMQSAASRMSQLVKDLLTFSRISTSQAVTRPVLLSDVVGRAQDNLSVAIGETGAVIEVGPLPIVRGDMSQLSQLFQNLLSNALKFHRTGPTGGAIAPHIRIQASEVPREALPAQSQLTSRAAVYRCIEVIDNGIGFDEKYRDRIFQVFQRLHSRNEFAGTGVGLAIVQKVVANHGGIITVSSQPGHGATFSVYLPALET